MRYQQTFVFALTALFAVARAQFEKRAVPVSCPGVLHIQDSSTVCCVGGSLSIADPQLSSCAGWPICTGPVTISESSTPENPPLTCATVIDVNNPSYSSILASATASIAASGTAAETTINPTGPAATPGSSASRSGSATATSASRTSGSSGSSTSAATSATANAAAAVDMSGVYVGGLAAGAIGAVAAFIL